MSEKPETSHGESGPDRSGKAPKYSSRFHRAVRKARAVQAKKEQRQARSRRFIRSLVLAAVLIVWAGLVVALVLPGSRNGGGLLPTPAVAEGFSGLTAVVISSYDRHVVPGVEVYEKRPNAQGQEHDVLVAVTDSQGIFNLAVDDRSPERTYILRHNGAKVGELTAGSGEQAASGYQRIQVDVPPEKLLHEYPVTVEPGGEIELSPILRVALAADATRPWTGTVVHDERWPTEFNYGDILEGIFQVDGEAPSGLQLRVNIESEQLRLSQTTPEDVRLIAHSQEYLDWANSSQDANVKDMAICHRGWYCTADPPLDDLPQTALTMSADTDGSSWLCWTPENGRSYALLAPPHGKWQADVVYSWPAAPNAEQPVDANISLIKQSGAHLVTWLYDAKELVEGKDEPFYLPIYTQSNYPSINARIGEPRGYGDTYEWHNEMIKAAEGGIIPAKYYLRRYDLTTCMPQLQGPFEVDTSFRPGHYEITPSEAKLGSVVELELNGDLDRIKGQPMWDFNHDAVPEAYGTSASFLATSPGSHTVNVTLQDVSGKYVRVTRQISVLADGLLYCLPAGHATNAVVSGVGHNPPVEKSLWLISENVIGGRPANSLSITNTAGPTMYIQPPADWVGKRLKEIREVLFVSPRAGDYDRMFISFGVNAVKATADPARGFEYIQTMDGEVGGKELVLQAGAFQTVGVCWPTELSLRAQADPDSGETARQAWMEYLKSTSIGFWVQTNLGFDYNNPPSNDKFVKILHDFKESPYYSVKFATREKQELDYASPLFGVEVTPDMAFLAGSTLEHRNVLLASQYEVYSGGRFPARVELETTDGDVYVRYFDYSVLKY